VISFGRIVWMLEKAGIDPELVPKQREAVIGCAYNIAHWWIIEHHHRRREDMDISFLGEIAMLQGMVPAALWLSMQEYGGVWDRGRFLGDYGYFEQFRFLGDHKGAAVFNTLQVYGMGTSLGPVWQPTWYRSDFVEWAKAILRLTDVPDIYKHKPNQQSAWCGMTWSPYPFVTAVESKVSLGSTGGVDEWWRMEDPSPMPVSEDFLIPKWGAHL